MNHGEVPRQSSSIVVEICRLTGVFFEWCFRIGPLQHGFHSKLACFACYSLCTRLIRNCTITVPYCTWFKILRSDSVDEQLKGLSIASEWCETFVNGPWLGEPKVSNKRSVTTGLYSRRGRKRDWRAEQKECHFRVPDENVENGMKMM